VAGKESNAAVGVVASPALNERLLSAGSGRSLAQVLKQINTSSAGQK
jgi:hypothetical protein